MAALNGKTTRLPSPSAEVGGSLRNIAADVLEMADLQLQLVRAETRVVRRMAVRASILFVASIGILLAGSTVLFVGGSLLVHELADWPLSWSYLAVGGGATLIAGLTLWMTVWRLGRVASSFQGSFAELRHNLAWFRRMLTPSVGDPERSLS